MLADLLATDGVVEEAVLRGPVGVMALHGGLESRTATAARRCAALSGASLYTVVQPTGFRWHVPSTRFDPYQSTRLKGFLEHVRLAVSLHGFGRRGLETSVLVGGRNERLGARLGEAIERRTGLTVVVDRARIPRGLRGMHPSNPVNLPELGGAQLELSQEARREGTLEGVISAVADVLTAERSSVCAVPRSAGPPAAV